MKNKKTGIIWIIAAIIIAAAGIALAIIYKDEILERVSSIKEAFEKKRYACISRKEYEDYADVE